MRRPSTVESRHRPSLRRWRRGAGERGETLIELLVTVVILSTAVVAVVGALMVAIRVSDLHRKQATAGAAVREFAEVLERAVAQVPSQYQLCGSAGQYLAMYTDPPANYTPHVDGVQVWDGTNFIDVIPSPCNDQGVQLVKLRVTSDGGQVSESLDVILRLPCRPGVDLCDPSP